MHARKLSTAIFFVVTLPAALALSGPPDAESARRLDSLLRAWEKNSTNLRDVRCEFQLTTKDAVFGDTKVEFGKASAIRPYLGRLDLRDRDGNWSRIFVSTGKTVHQYEFKTKQEIVHVLPTPAGATGDTMPGPLKLIFGMTARDAKTRFDMTLLKEFDRDGKSYAIVEAVPREKDDLREFKQAKLVIDKSTYLPREILIIEPNGDQQNWIFTVLETNPAQRISAKDLAPLNTPKDWKRIENKYGEPPLGAESTTPASGITKPGVTLKSNGGTTKSAPPKSASDPARSRSK